MYESWDQGGYSPDWCVDHDIQVRASTIDFNVSGTLLNLEDRQCAHSERRSAEKVERIERVQRVFLK